MEIPLTKLRDFYSLLRVFSTETEINMIRDFNRKNNYLKLVEIFNESKKHFEKYISKEKFTGNSTRKTLPHNPVEISNTNDLVSILNSNSVNHVINNSGLDFKYVDREISTLRTTGNVRFENGHSGRSSGTGGLDFIAWNIKDNLPVLGEVKVKNDENPFFALIQLMTYLSELVTPNQIARINNTDLFKGNTGSKPYFYLYILHSNHNLNSKERRTLLKESIILAKNLQNSIQEIKEVAFIKLDSPAGDIMQIL